MRRIILLLNLVQISCYLNGQIIADHTIVDKFDKIPQNYINEVKKMWLVYAGESHSAAIRTGLTLLESAYPAFQVNITEEGTPESYTTSHLRASRATWGNYTNSSGWIYSYGEEDWFSNSTAPIRTKAGITYCNTHNLIIGAMGFGWCWDPAIYTTADFNMYINATEQYIAHCASSGYPTKIFFTTGTVDYELYYGEIGYKKYLGNQLIRAHVNSGTDRILFDYADILCYDAGSEIPNTTTWNGYTYPIITATNLGNTGIGHIGSAGALRLAKAMWWMLARIAGWDGVSSGIMDIPNNSPKLIKKIVTDDEIKLYLNEYFISWNAKLIDYHGKLILEKPVLNDELSFDVSSLGSGIYFVVLSNRQQRQTEKFIKP